MHVSSADAALMWMSLLWTGAANGLASCFSEAIRLDVLSWQRELLSEIIADAYEEEWKLKHEKEVSHNNLGHRN